VRELRAIAAAAGRPARQRTTTYAAAPEERVAVGERFDGHLPQLLPLVSD
jgi:FO synthase